MLICIDKFVQLFRKFNMNEYIINDLNLADWGRKEISVAESEMPGLMACETLFEVKTVKRCKNSWMFAYDDSNSCVD